MSNSHFRLLLICGVIAMTNVSHAVDDTWESPAEKVKVDKKIGEIEAVIQKGPFKDDWDSLKNYQIPGWFQDAKFGIFIHWGLYSVPAYANEWYSRNMYQQGDDAFKHHVETYGTQDKFGYKDFIPLFKAGHFDPSHWAKVFKEAGAKYVVPVAEHHDGFALYDSDFSRWTAAKMGPKKDLIDMEDKAYEAAGLMPGASSHRAEHWWFMSGGRKFDSDVRDPKYQDFYGPAVDDDSSPNDEYLRNWLARSCEIVDKYRPRIMYFDWWVGERTVFAPYLRKFMAYYYNRAVEWKKEVVLCTKDKAYVPGTAVQDVEKGGLPDISSRAWQTDTSISWKSWAYLKDDSLKDTGFLIRTLINAVSKNGNLLLDVGPKPDGTIPEDQEKILQQIGSWLKTNGEAIYGTRPWVAYGDGPTADTQGKFSESDVKYQEGDVRFTRKGNLLYVFSLVPPTKPFTIPKMGLKAAPALKVSAVSLLGSKEPVKWERTDQGLTLPPPSRSSSYPVVYRLTLSGAARGSLTLHTLKMGLTAGTVIQNYGESEWKEPVSLSVGGKEVSMRDVAVGANGTEEVQLDFQARNPGLYQVSLNVPLQSPLTARAALPAMNLSGEWLFNKGDNAGWKKPGLDDSAWQKVNLPAQWTDYGYKCDNCFAWYRKHVTVPAEWKGHAILLPLGKIDDTDASYFNGIKIGQTGEFPPNFKGFWDKPRQYEVPAKLIHFGGDNVVSVRVFNAYGGAGIYDGPLDPVEVK